MTELQTVFEITRGPSEIQMLIYSFLAVDFIVSALAIGSIVLYVTRRKTIKWKPRLYTTISLAVLAVCWLCFTIPCFSITRREFDSLLAAYQAGDYEVAEGPVRVLRTQPESGHAPGDLIAVGDTRFEISFFSSSHAYHRTIAHGGCLREGVYAKVFHRNGDILRIDVKPGNTGEL